MTDDKTTPNADRLISTLALRILEAFSGHAWTPKSIQPEDKEIQKSCINCRFFESFDDPDTHRGDDAGYCRRYPPQLSSSMLEAATDYSIQAADYDADCAQDRWEGMLRETAGSTNWLFPTVEGYEDVCGEWIAKEQQLQG